MHNQSNRNLWHNCKSNNKAENNKNNLHQIASRRTLHQEFFVMYCITFTLLLLFLVPFRVQLVDILRKLLCFNIFIGIFVKIFCIWNIILGLYRVAHECGHSQAPVLKLQKEKCEQDQQSLQSAPPPKDEYLVGIQTRQTLVIEDNSSLLTPLTIDEPE